MMRDPVASSTVVSIGYGQATETLEVEFLNGGIYQYYNVGQVVYDEFLTAPSKGQYLYLNIRNFYPYSRVG
ncbi:KTSC domain-containing protein [Sinorhizobium arboris]|nr:KTSC domain-containing protein [Sinorhizobium arboris]